MAPSMEVQRRRSERRPHHIEVTLLAKVNGVEYEEPAHTVDLSDHGLGILTDNPANLSRTIEPGQIVYIMGIGESRLGYYRVVWTRTAPPQSPVWAGLKYLN
jgi:hypothetical protein